MNGEPPTAAQRHPQGGGLFDQQVVGLAPLLLGAVLEHRDAEGTVAVRLTEVEAYAGAGDLGSHAHRARTARNATMFGSSGRLYVYFTYGLHWCVNIVCEPEGEPAAILLRAGQIVHGADLARSRRPAARRDRDLARGPARLAAALGLNGTHDGHPVLTVSGGAVSDGAVSDGAGSEHGVRLVLPAGTPASRVCRGPRVGIRGPGGDGKRFPWRFWLEGEPTVSVYRPAAPRPRREPQRKPSRPSAAPGENLAPEEPRP
ncbi:MAG: DNA-3-methyladenine glycosylase [Actinomycetota bacterium]|nr:DNA-3-methyladenine glycosylase [Actinomycetota bacterium]